MALGALLLWPWNECPSKFVIGALLTIYCLYCWPSHLQWQIQKGGVGAPPPLKLAKILQNQPLFYQFWPLRPPNWPPWIRLCLVKSDTCPCNLFPSLPHQVTYLNHYKGISIHSKMAFQMILTWRDYQVGKWMTLASACASHWTVSTMCCIKYAYKWYLHTACNISGHPLCVWKDKGHSFHLSYNDLLTRVFLVFFFSVKMNISVENCCSKHLLIVTVSRNNIINVDVFPFTISTCLLMLNTITRHPGLIQAHWLRF